MTIPARLPTAFFALSIASCTTATPLEVPRFAKDDPRVNTAGFVGQTTRIDRMVGATKHTLMIFAVGDTLTLGAMVEGPFTGTAHWTVGAREFAVPLDRSNRGSKAVTVSGPTAAGLAGQHGGFRDYDWVNVEVELTEWLPATGTPVRLEFRAAGGAPVVLPESGTFRSRVAMRRP